MSTLRVAAVGDVLAGRYRVEDILAQGGQGLLLRAATRGGPDVAVKQLIADPSDSNYGRELARWKRTASLQVGHPSVLDPIEAFEDDGQHYIVFPLLDGMDLATWLETNPGPVEPELARGLITAIVEALGSIHDRGIVHRDLKPGNVFLERHGAVRLLDLGIARNLRESTISPSGTRVGSLAWMAPEQLETSEVDHRADLFALGLIFYRLLTGVQVRTAGTEDELRAEIRRSITPVTDTTPGIDHRDASVCMRLLQQDPSQRYRTARDVVEALSGPSTIVHRCLACGARVTDHNRCSACRRAFSDPPYMLVFLSGPASDQGFVAAEGMYVVGREVLCPRDRHIARQQMAIGVGSWDQGGFWLRDGGAANPTRVDGVVPSRSVCLRDDSRVSIATNEAVVQRCWD